MRTSLPIAFACLSLVLAAAPLAAGTHEPPGCTLTYATFVTAAGTFYVVTDGDPFDSCVYATAEVWQECNSVDDWQHDLADNPDCRIV